MDKTKKTQRSYSSFRAKTQQAEINDEHDTSWMNSQNGQKILKHLNHKISTSQLVPCNQALFQSVSERIPYPRNTAHYNSCLDAQAQHTSEYEQQSTSSHHGLSTQKLQKVISHLRQKCKNYQKALQFFNRERQQSLKQPFHNKQNIKHSHNFNYSEQYYLKEVEDLRKQVLVKDAELDKFRQLYTSKSTEVEGISKQISQRIDKENDDKTLYIKELNIKNIEIKKLTERLELFMSELKAKEFVIKEKDDKVEDLLKQLEGFGHKKLKIESYQQKIHENQHRLKQIQQHTLRLKEQINKKDQLYKQKADQVYKMDKTFEDYQQKLKLFEASYLEEMQKKTKLQESFDQLKAQHQKTKMECVKMALLKQLIKDKEVENKMLVVGVEEAKRELAEFTEQNEALRQEVQTMRHFEGRLQTNQSQLAAVKKLLRQKDQIIASHTTSKDHIQQLQHMASTLQQQLTHLHQTLSHKDSKISALEGQLLNYQTQLEQVTQENELLQGEIEKSKQKEDKLNNFYKQNQKLNSHIHQKINQIQKLQQRIATLETKLTNLAHQNSKIKSAKDDLTHQTLKLQSTLEQSNQNLSRQYSIRQELELILEQHSDQLTKRQHECTAYKATLNQLEQQNVRLCNQLDDLVEKHAQETQHMEHRLQEYEQQKQQGNQMMQQANSKIVQLNSTVMQCKRSLDDLGIREMAHIDMLQRVEVELRKSHEERDRLVEDKRKLSQAMERIYSISFETMKN